MPLSALAAIHNGNSAAETESPPLQVLVIDDQSTAREILSAIVLAVDPRAVVHKLAHPGDAVAWAASNDVDFVLTDYRMPVMDGVEVVRRLRLLPHAQDIPIVVVTMFDDRKVRHAALDAGATDFLSKPLDQHECLVRCRNLMTMRRQQVLLRERAVDLASKVALATDALRKNELKTLLMLARAGELRDTDTGNHVLRVSKLTGLIARRLRLANPLVLETAAQLHDIGKIGISDTILLKPGRLTEDEMTVMREHTRIGHSILTEGETDYMLAGAEIAISHHERFDGGGYPKGLAGHAIPISGRVVAVVDTLDALLSRRPYKAPWTREEAFAHVAAQAGGQFDPACVEALLECRAEAEAILDSLK